MDYQIEEEWQCRHCNATYFCREGVTIVACGNCGLGGYPGQFVRTGNICLSDGDVDGDDFLAWQTGFGIHAGAQKSDGDYDNDGDVDGDDFLGWQAEFSSGGGPISGTVPEPAAALLMMILVSAVACFQRCRRAERVSKLVSA